MPGDMDIRALSDSLQEASMALRRFVPTSSICSTAASQSSGNPWAGGAPLAKVPRPTPAELHDERWPCVDEFEMSGQNSPSMPSMLLGGSLSPVSGPSASWSGADAVDMKRLMFENATLREAYNDANRRLVALEEEKNRFFDEGIYDVVNSVCGKASDGKEKRPNGGPSLPLGAYGAAFGMLGAFSGFEQGSPKAPSTMVDMDLSPMADMEALQLRRYEEEARSTELKTENDALRRELRRVESVGVASENQYKAAEDRMHELEQEALMLRGRIAHLSASGASPDVVSAYAAAAAAAGLRAKSVAAAHYASAFGTPPNEERVRLSSNFSSDSAAAEAAAEAASLRIAVAEAAAAERCEEAAKAAAAQAREEQRRLENAALEAERRRVAEFQSGSTNRDRMIGDLNMQALEKRLRETEARARHLEEANAKLQAALVADTGSNRTDGADELPAEAELVSDTEFVNDIPGSFDAAPAADELSREPEECEVRPELAQHEEPDMVEVEPELAEAPRLNEVSLALDLGDTPLDLDEAW